MSLLRPGYPLIFSMKCWHYEIYILYGLMIILICTDSFCNFILLFKMLLTDKKDFNYKPSTSFVVYIDYKYNFISFL